MPRLRGGKRSARRLVLPVFVIALPATAWAQDAAYFSPTYAASEGSPYSEIYARTFGAGGPPIETSAPPPVLAPPPAAPLPQANGDDGDLVYVIDDGRLLTFRAEDYASGSGQAVARALLPAAAPAHDFNATQVRVPTIADRLYGNAPLETAAGPNPVPAPAPIQLVPPQN